MNITILTPDKEIFKGKAVSVKVPGTLGQFQILKNHAPIVSSLDAGKVELVTAEGSYQYYDEESGALETEEKPGRSIAFEITGGFVEVLKNESVGVLGAHRRFHAGLDHADKEVVAIAGGIQHCKERFVKVQKLYKTIWHLHWEDVVPKSDPTAEDGGAKKTATIDQLWRAGNKKP